MNRDENDLPRETLADKGSGREQRTSLRELLEKRLEDSELLAICIDLRMDFQYADLYGSHQAKVSQLIEKLEKRKSLDKLADVLARMRPDIPQDALWAAIRDVTPPVPPPIPPGGSRHRLAWIIAGGFLLLIVLAILFGPRLVSCTAPSPSLTPTTAPTTTPLPASPTSVPSPQFEITALDTLEGDTNAYEVTDHLIWNRDKLDEYGVVIAFTLEILPRYNGDETFGSVVAIISGSGKGSPIEKPLWTDFGRGSGSQQIQLTLAEVVEVSGLRLNSEPSVNVLRPGDPFFQHSSLTVQIARAADRAHPWASQEITIRNAPWEFQSALVERDGRREVDVYVKNLGGDGWFTMRYRLVRLEKEIESSSLPEVSGTTTIRTWNAPQELVYLRKGEFFTDTAPIAGPFAQGRHLLEVYAVKQQNHVQFQDPKSTWKNLNSLDSPWWFGETPSDMHLFVVTEPEFSIDPVIQAEWERLRDQEDIDLGLALGPADEVTSAKETTGLRQVFQGGEIYTYDGKAFALYGSILDHYNGLGEHESQRIGFPISPIRDVTSSWEVRGAMMEFEGGPNYPPSVIYTSRKGTAAIWSAINRVYREDYGGHAGWLGFPVSDVQYHKDSEIQRFEGGYIVYVYPCKDGMETCDEKDRDWSRPLVAYPYLSSRGRLFDVYANQPWQDTDIQIEVGDRLEIVQIGGAWTEWESSIEPHDANGNPGWESQEGAPFEMALVGALIGRIGTDDRSIFSVGRWYERTCTEAGTLYLAMNDARREDNAGFITVQITVEPSEGG